MSNLKKRNSEIIQTRNKGSTYQEIADLFELSRERVRQIIVRSELEKKQRLQSEKILAILKTTDDIKKNGQPISWLMDSSFPKRRPGL
jgi:DNA-directed RNA polymerase sigma subunit (sigma70/sigma32)